MTSQSTGSQPVDEAILPVVQSNPYGAATAMRRNLARHLADNRWMRFVAESTQVARTLMAEARITEPVQRRIVSSANPQILEEDVPGFVIDVHSSPLNAEPQEQTATARPSGESAVPLIHSDITGSAGAGGIHCRQNEITNMLVSDPARRQSIEVAAISHEISGGLPSDDAQVAANHEPSRCVTVSDDASLSDAYVEFVESSPSDSEGVRA